MRAYLRARGRAYCEQVAYIRNFMRTAAPSPLRYSGRSRDIPARLCLSFLVYLLQGRTGHETYRETSLMNRKDVKPVKCKIYAKRVSYLKKNN